MAIPTDPLYALQWHFPMLGGIETIWDDYDGIGVTVAVYDSAAQVDHPDFGDNYDPTAHFVDQNGNVYVPAASDAHATAVAGLIGAERDNGIGGAGVASGVMLTNVDFVNDLQSQPDKDALMAEAIRYAANFDVMNNSWGEFAGYGYLSSLLTLSVDPDPAGSLADLASRTTLFHQAYAEIAATGRGGLGTVVVQSAGNDSSNANGYGLNASRFTVTVSGTDQQGEATFFSNWGSAVLVAAPEAAVTTDLTGRDGVNGIANQENYTNLFSGTSAAAPVVSGVVALMLEANEDLGWRDVQNILAYSAAMTGTPYGGTPRGYERSDWAGNGTDFFNGGALTYHYNYGFGQVDAFAAVRMAEIWTRMTGEAQTSANEATAEASFDGPDVVILDAGGVDPHAEISLTVADNISIEHIEVTISGMHDTAANTLWTLVAPDGTELPFLLNEGVQYVELGGWFVPRDALMENGFTWTFGVTAFLGVESAGTWTLRVADSGADGLNDDVISGFALDFYGSAPTDDTIHTFTEDFAELRGIDADRDTIEDAGGTDWLNLVALKGDVVIDLAAGGFSVDGTEWASEGATTQIENVALGDGDDRATGDAAANDILGGRGDDWANGGQGNDTLEGGAGADTLIGDSGRDQLIGGADGDYLRGGGGHDSLSGGTGDDSMLGGGNNDTLAGGDGADTLDGNAGKDRLFGNAGADQLNGGNGNDRLVGGSGADTALGGEGSDWITGSGGMDSLDGGAGDDRLFGENGADTLFGGEGNDTLSGGARADTFQFSTADTPNSDTILDFMLGVDALHLDDLGFTSLDSGSDLELSWAGGHSLTLLGVTDASALADDIVLIV